MRFLEKSGISLGRNPLPISDFDTLNARDEWFCSPPSFDKGLLFVRAVFVLHNEWNV
jgi:hypothetical protein